MCCITYLHRLYEYLLYKSQIIYCIWAPEAYFFESLTCQFSVQHKTAIQDKYCLLTHIHEIWRDGTDEPICRAWVETQTQRTDCGVGVAAGRRGWDELRAQH